MRRPDELVTEILKVCPISGTSHRIPGETEIQFKQEATPEQRDAAQAIVDGWNWNAPSATDVENNKIKAILTALDDNTATLTQIRQVLAHLVRQIR